MSWYDWSPYVPVAERRARALKKMEKLRKKGLHISPIKIEGRTIARTFWGKAWCDHLESFSDYANRLPRGRTYIRNGSVCHLDIQKSQINAMVNGSELYTVKIDIEPLPGKQWEEVKNRCAGQIGSLLELLQGRLSTHVMSVVTDRGKGLFPLPKEISLNCSCPDWAVMCKHVAAALYGVGARLDTNPELLFLLRGVDHEELISSEVHLHVATAANKNRRRIADEALADVFGIELSEDDPSAVNKMPKQKVNKKSTSSQTSEKGVLPTAKGRAKTGSKSTGSQKISTDARRQSEADSNARPVTGKSVAALRAKFGMSKSQFARLMGVSPASVGKWEKSSGTLNFHAHTLDLWNKIKNMTKRQVWRKLDDL